MPTFTQAKIVEPDQTLDASHIGSLAAAFNSRILSGVGDAVWRIPYYLHAGLWRSIRNPDASFNLYPPDGEFWNIYEFVRPQDAEWPVTGPGDPEGTNVSNIMGAFVYGNEGLGIGSELRRLAQIPVGTADDSPLTPAIIWALGQAQRGAYDPETGFAAWPVGDTAKAYAWVRQSMLSPHGNAWGGFLPGPDRQYGCTDPIQPNPVIKFTNFVTNQVLTFDTNCPEDAGAVGISYSPFAYYVFHASGAIQILPKNQWIEGPYDGNAQLTKTQANALGRVLHHYATEFRGMAFQGGGQNISSAFDLHKFLTTQYPLAPNVGIAESDGISIQARYPRWDAVASPITTDTELRYHHSGGAQHSWLEGTMCTGFIVISNNLTAPTVLEIREGSTVLKSFKLPTAHHEELFWLPVAKRLQDVKLVVTTATAYETGGGIFVEATELLEYKPEIHDYYLVTRLSSFLGTLDRIDGRGIDMDRAKEIGENLYLNGCVIPVVEAPAFSPAGMDPTFNQNAVVDGARRLTLDYCRLIPRFNLIGYAVESGKSILWFTRGAYGGGATNERDMWQGIGPSVNGVELGSIKWGYTYVVETGEISYGNPNDLTHYEAGKTFVGLEGVTEWTGNGTVREANGIRRTATPGEFSNRWCLSVALKAYELKAASIYKEDAFTDVITPFWSRCHFDAPEISLSQSTALHMTFGQTPALVPEAPSGFTYAQVKDASGVTNINRKNCAEEDTDCLDEKLAFYKSCRIYEPPVEIEKVEHVVEGVEVVAKVTLTGRLHHHEDAPASIARDATAWNIVDLNAETYRTHENGIRDYLVRFAQQINAPVRVGDHALNSGIDGDLDKPFGSCYPTFVVLRLMPDPYLDANSTYESHDSPTQHDQIKQAELYLRAMCEGYVDGITSVDRACEIGTVSAYDYTFENLLFQAADNRWVSPVPLSLRPDNPYGFGPGPTLKYHSEVYNAIAAGVNLLTDARIMLPIQLLSRSNQGVGEDSATGRDQCGAPINCTGFGGTVFVISNGTASAGGGILSGWGEFTDGQGANYGWNLKGGSGSGACDGDFFLVEALKTTLELKWELIDPDAYAALPGNLGALLDTDSVAMMKETRLVGTTRHLTGLVAPYDSTAAALVANCGGVYSWVIEEVVTTEHCSLIHGSVIPPEPGGGPLLTVQSGSPGGPPGTSYGVGPTSAVSVEVFTDNTGIVRIPTAAYTGGT